MPYLLRWERKQDSSDEISTLRHSGDASDLLVKCPTCPNGSCFFHRLLQESSGSSTIPDAIVCLGLLTNHLMPSQGELTRYKQIARRNIRSVPPVSLSRNNVVLVVNLLNESKEKLSAEQKGQIGTLCESAHLNRPTKLQSRGSSDIFSAEFTKSSTEKEKNSKEKNEATGATKNDRKRQSSIISEAKRKAKSQGREAAIDPKFNKTGDNKNHLLNSASKKSKKD